jgi:hypothetical protein
MSLRKYVGPNVLCNILANIPGVARDSIRNEGTREINYGIKKITVC